MSVAGTAGLAGCSGAENSDVAGGAVNDPANESTAAGGESTDATQTDEPTATSEQTADVPDVTIDSHELFKSALDFAEIRGEVTNTSGETQSYIEVEGTFFDDADTRIGTTMWNASDVPADQTIAFETVMSTTDYEKVARYELVSTTSVF